MFDLISVASIRSPVSPGDIAFIGLLGTAAIFDAWSFRILNVVALLLAIAFPAAALLIGIPVDWPYHIVGAAVVLVAGMLLFMRDLLGGGDVKLLAAATLWYGLDRLPAFLFAVSLAGGLLALAVLLVRATGRLRPLPAGRLRGAVSLRRINLPYGVAIALGGLLVRPLLGS